MTEANPNPPAQTKPSDPTQPAPKKKRSKFKLLLKLFCALIVLVVLLVVLAPTIISLSPVRSFVVGKVDDAIPGRVEIASWSFGWFSPVKIEGVKLFDRQNRQILAADEISTEATLLQLARQNFDLRKTVVRVDATYVEIRPDGTTNLHDELGLKPSTEEPSKEPVTVPDVKVDLTLDVRGSATLLDDKGKPITTVQLRQGSGGTVKIADVNKGIDTDLKFVYDVMQNNAAGTPSTITLAGTADAVENNKLDLLNLAAKLKLALANVQTKAIEPVLTMAGVKDITADATLDGALDVDLQPGQTGGAKGKFTLAVKELRVPQFPDAYKTKDPIEVPIDISRVNENGASRIRIDIRATTPEMNASIIGDLPEAVLQKLAEQKMPGDDGSLVINFNADPRRAAEAFPNTLKLLPGVSVRGGSLFAKIDLWLKPDQIIYGVSTNISASGTRDGRAIQIEPVTLATAGTVTSLADPVMGLRDLSLKLASTFANFTGGGTSVRDLSLNGTADLDKLHAQAAQFSDLSQFDLAGQAVVDIRNRTAPGATTQPSQPVDYLVDAGVTLTSIHVKSPKLAKPIDLPYLKAGINSAYTLVPDTAKPISMVRSANATIALGDSEKDLLLDGELALTDVDPNALSVKRFELKKGTITNLAKLQQRIDPFVPALRQQGIELTDGQVYLVASGSASVPLGEAAKTVPMRVVLEKLELSTPSLRVNKDGKEILRDRIAVAVVGAIEKTSAQQVIDLSQLKVTSESGMVSVEKTDAPLRVVMGDAPIPHGSGQLKINSNLIPVNRIVQALAKEPVQQITGGQFDGVLTLASGEKDSSVALDGKLASLTLPGVVENQTINVTLGGTVAGADPTQAKNAVVTANLRSDGLFSFVTQEPASVTFATGTPVARMVEKAKLQIGVNDVRKAYQIAAALVPGLNPPYTPNSGGVSIVATVVPERADLDIKASRLELRDQQGKTFTFDKKKPVTITLGVQVKGEKEITQLVVDKLDADADLAKVTLVEPIVVDDPLGTPKPRGLVEVTGTIDRATQLIQFLSPESKPLPFRGAFRFRNKLAMSGDDITATIDGTVTDLTVLNDRNQPVVTEKEVKVTGDLAANLTTQVAKINKLDILTVNSNAVKITVTGRARDFLKNTILCDKLTARIDAVGEQAWPLVFPLLPPEQQAKLAKAKISGPIVVNVFADGPYVKAGPKNEALELGKQISSLYVKGDLSLASADLMESYGLGVTDFKQLFTIEKGRLITGHKDATTGKFTFAPSSKVNGGELNLGSIVIDLNSPDMLVKVGKNQKIMIGVQLNPVMAASLGSLASVIFKDAKEATGLVDVTVVECENVPLADLTSGKKGTATILYSIRNLRIDGPLPSLLASTLSWGESGIVGSIDDGKLTLAEGVAHQDMAIKVLKTVEQENARSGRREKVDVAESLSFNGGVDLARGRFKNYTMTISRGLLLRDWRDNFANGMKIGIDGRVDDYMSVIAQAVTKTVGTGVAVDQLEKLLRKK